MSRAALSRPLMVVAVLVVLGATPSRAQDVCQVKPVPLSAVGAGHASYGATVGPWRLTIRNEEAPRPATSFNEYPLEVTDTRSGKTCRIDGGIWIPAGFAAVQDQNRLVAIESSGSDVTLTVYDLPSCRALRRVPVPSGVVGFQGGDVRIGEQCKGHTLSSCRTSQAIPAATLCR